MAGRSRSLRTQVVKPVVPFVVRVEELLHVVNVVAERA
jgi:hypothetical protein